ncbi:MAG: hypothetical protein ACJAVV_001602 [Alphaproteobacteria bacterium]
MIKEAYSKIATYLMETFGANFIFFTMLLTTIASVVCFIVISYIITQMDKRYFIRKRLSGENSHLTSMNTSLNFVIKILQIIVGICLLVCGLVMLVLPGQGLITILIGLSLLPFPGKNKLEQNLLSRKSVRSTLNWIRMKANKEPFIFD